MIFLKSKCTDRGEDNYEEGRGGYFCLSIFLMTFQNHSNWNSVNNGYIIKVL
jgi:hypothetical protein